MENLKNVSLVHAGVAGAILAADLLDMVPSMVSNLLSNKIVQVVLAVGVLTASYYSVENAVVLAALLYVALNQEASAPAPEPAKAEAEASPVPEVNNTGVRGVESEPDMEPVADPLPTQDNTSTAVESVVEAPVTPAPEDATIVNKEDLSKLEGFSGVNDMATL